MKTSLLLVSVPCLVFGQSTGLEDPGAAAAFFKADGANEVRMVRANLDEDRDEEAIVIASWKRSRRPPRAIVFDRRSDAWRQVAEFDGGLHWADEGSARFVQVRSLVSPDREDLIVRDATGGTGFVGIRLAVHRMRNGTLHEVFSGAESQETYEFDKQVTVLEAATFDFQPPRIVERRREIREPELRTSQKPHAQSDTCGVFQWSEPAFRFVPDPAATCACPADENDLHR